MDFFQNDFVGFSTFEQTKLFIRPLKVFAGALGVYDERFTNNVLPVHSLASAPYYLIAVRVTNIETLPRGTGR